MHPKVMPSVDGIYLHSELKKILYVFIGKKRERERKVNSQVEQLFFRDIFILLVACLAKFTLETCCKAANLTLLQVKL